MYKIDHCPACHNSDVAIQSGRLARFVAWRALGAPVDTDIVVQGLKCPACSFVGSVDRFTAAEETNLYADYRGDEYNRIRNICEPLYHKSTEFIEDQAYYDNRKIGITTLITRHIDIDNIGTVLDYGGDTGSMIPNNLNHAQRYVYDISDVPTVNGVIKYDGVVKTFDFLMCCHVLEHKPNPDELLHEIKQHVDKDSWIYFEVPNNPNAYVGTFHEHINFFNPKSLAALLDRNGFEVLDHYEYGFDCEIPCHANNLCMLTKLKE
jgi:SAM-dependent methyltransferase